ncbi:MAG: hypothetical protein IJF10_03890, partial [Clostridia bacterium]|nr:hypothetical protein [Clostridia bacterium]
MKKFAIVLLLATVAVLLVGCVLTPPSTNFQRNVRVVLPQGENYRASNYVYTSEYGKDVQLSITLDVGFSIVSCNYHGEYVLQQQGTQAQLTLKNVCFDTRLALQLSCVSGVICYNLNGGVKQDCNEDYFFQHVDTSVRLRHNTDTALDVSRQGYTLLGWNTQADGNGQHIGLGSKVTVQKDQFVQLFAQWAKWENAESFQYQQNLDTEQPDDIVLTAYVGNDNVDWLVIPEQIDGMQVTAIAGTFSSQLCIGKLVFPRTLQMVEKRAFHKSQIGEIFFFDNISQVGDSCFGNNIATLHINAVLPPRYRSNDLSYFVESMDWLILNKSNPKMVFFGGCSMSYGLNSKMVEQHFNNQYVVCNVGIIGGTTATFQMDCISAYLQQGDVFVHAPEQMSTYQLMVNTDAELRMFVCVEANYDLLALADLSQCNYVFDCFNVFNHARQELPEENYDVVNNNYNKNGDYVVYRQDSAQNAQFDIQCCFVDDYMSQQSFANLNKYYAKMQGRGAKVFVSFAPLNKNALTDDEWQNSVVRYVAMFNTYLDKDYKVISTLGNYIMDGR